MKKLKIKNLLKKNLKKQIRKIILKKRKKIKDFT